MEYLLVHCFERRRVIIGGAEIADTEAVIQLQAGGHRVTLATPPDNFSPPDIPVVLTNTTPLSPLEITFVRKV